MSSKSSCSQIVGDTDRADFTWYALYTRSRHEKKVACELERVGVRSFLPVVNEVHRWSDRRQKVDVPLFPCYLFVHLPPEPRYRAKALLTSGVLGFVGPNGGSPIPENEIEAVRTVIGAQVPISRCTFSPGQRVRVRGGALDGVVGVLVSDPHERRLVVAVGQIHQALSVSVEACQLEAVA